MRLKALVVLCALLVLAAVPSAHAQSITTADLAGDWAVFQLATPASAFTASQIRAYRGTLTFDATGAVTSGTLTDNAQPVPISFAVTGTLTLTPAGVVDGTLTLDDSLGGGGLLDVREARLLVTKNTIVGASTVLTQPGLFTLVKLAAAPFQLDADLAGDWNYQEITPSNNFTTNPGDATSVKGSITFHQGSGCTEADLTLADGRLRAERDADPQSFG